MGKFCIKKELLLKYFFSCYCFLNILTIYGEELYKLIFAYEINRDDSDLVCHKWQC